MSEAVAHLDGEDGTRLAYRRFGDGPCVLTCLHSLALDGSWFAPLAAAMGEGYTCLCPDFRGHGASEYGPSRISLARIAADVLALWDRLGIRGGALVGVSLGGMVAKAVLSAAPARVDALALLATTHAYDDAATVGAHTRAAAARAAGGMALLEAATLERWFGDAAGDNDDWTVTRARAQFLAADGEVHADYLEAMTEVGSLLPPRKPPPTLVLGATDDRSTPPPVLESLAASIPGSRLRFIRGGHLAAFHDPEAVASALAEFFDREPGSAAST
jgi:3-oxoadipate enol-lactonase